MSTKKAITIHLDTAEYEQLQAAARRTGMQPDALARSYVHTALQQEQPDAEQRKQEMLEALKELDEIAARMPPFDAEKLARESREDLERRSVF